MYLADSLKLGGLLDSANSTRVNLTGFWRQGKRPKWEGSKCVNCATCFHFCPEEAIMFKDGKMVGINYNYCKGCGICANECSRKAIEMINE